MTTTTQPNLMTALAQTALDEALAALADDAPTAQGPTTIGLAPAARGSTTAQRARKLVALAALDPARVGCIVWWSASEIQADPLVLRRAFLAAQRAADCPGCGSGAGRACVDATGAEHDEVCAARGVRLDDLVRDPVGHGTAMRRALARTQSSLADGLRWHDCGEDANGLHVALGEQRAGLTPGDVLASARWSLALDTGTGALSLPPVAALLDDERRALRALLDRYVKERAFLTAQDVGHLLVTLLLDRLGGVRVKSGGAVYFVPAPGDATVDRIAAACEVAGVHLRRVEVGAGAAPQLADSASESLEDEALGIVEAARGAVERLRASKAAEDGKGRPQIKSTLARLDEVDALRKRAKGYANLLGALTDNVEQALREAEAATREVLSDLTGGIV